MESNLELLKQKEQVNVQATENDKPTNQKRVKLSRKLYLQDKNSTDKSSSVNISPDVKQLPCIASLHNLGNTCYLNAVLQALRYTPGFVDNIHHLNAAIQAAIACGWLDEDCIEREIGPLKLVFLLHQLYKKMDEYEENYNRGLSLFIGLRPYELLDLMELLNPDFTRYQQHDSHELLQWLLGLLQDAWEKLKLAFANANYSTSDESHINCQSSSSNCSFVNSNGENNLPLEFDLKFDTPVVYATRVNACSHDESLKPKLNGDGERQEESSSPLKSSLKYITSTSFPCKEKLSPIKRVRFDLGLTENEGIFSKTEQNISEKNVDEIDLTEDEMIEMQVLKENVNSKFGAVASDYVQTISEANFSRQMHARSCKYKKVLQNSANGNQIPNSILKRKRKDEKSFNELQYSDKSSLNLTNKGMKVENNYSTDNKPLSDMYTSIKSNTTHLLANSSNPKEGAVYDKEDSESNDDDSKYNLLNKISPMQFQSIRSSSKCETNCLSASAYSPSIHLESQQFSLTTPSPGRDHRHYCVQCPVAYRRSPCAIPATTLARNSLSPSLPIGGKNKYYTTNPGKSSLNVNGKPEIQSDILNSVPKHISLSPKVIVKEAPIMTTPKNKTNRILFSEIAQESSSSCVTSSHEHNNTNCHAQYNEKDSDVCYPSGTNFTSSSVANEDLSSLYGSKDLLSFSGGDSFSNVSSLNDHKKVKAEQLEEDIKQLNVTVTLTRLSPKFIEKFEKSQVESLHLLKRLTARVVKKDPFAHLFHGKMVLKTKCIECESCSSQDQVFVDLGVSVKCKKTSNESDDEEEESCKGNKFLQSLSNVERLTEENKYKCNNCDSLVEAEISSHYIDLPPILVVHLKRFARTASGLGKILDHVACPRVLNCVRDDCVNCVEESHRYYLYAIISHIGLSLSSGHYMTYIKSPQSGCFPYQHPYQASRKLLSMKSDSTDNMDNITRRHSARLQASQFALQDNYANNDVWFECDDDKIKVLSDDDLDAKLSPSGTASPYILLYCRSNWKWDSAIAD